MVERGQKKKALRALKGYLARKKEETVLTAMARKSNYLRKLKSVLNLFRANIEY